MAPIQRIEAAQGFFTFDEDDWASQPCTCFHGTIPGQMDQGVTLTCGEAPWWCPSRPAPGVYAHQVYPPLSNRGVSSDDVDPASPGFNSGTTGE